MKRALVIISLLGLGFGITLLILFVPVRGSSVLPPSLIDNTETHQKSLLKQDTSKDSDDKVSSNDPEDYYRVIIENNIFRPLNWKPAQQEPNYTLLGTATTHDSRDATAYITERKTNQYYAVKVGEKIGNATVIAIRPKQVVLDQAGKTLMLSMASIRFLSRTRDSSRTAYRPPPPQIIPQSSDSQRAQPWTAKQTERQAWREAQKQRIAELRERAEKLRTVSDQERRKMQEYIEQRKTSGNSQ